MLFRSSRPRRFTARILAALTFAGIMTAACDVHSPTAPGNLVTLTVTPNVTLPINGTQQFTAVGLDALGDTVAVAPAWSIVAGGGTINGTGLFTAGTVPGVYNATVQATSGTLTATANVTVVAGPLSTITVTPNPQALAIGGTQQFIAVGHDVANNVVPITPVWTVTASGGTINATGLFTAGVVVGSFANTVRATDGTIFGTATVTVTAGPLATITVTPNPQNLAVGATQQFTAVGRDALNNIVTITPVWSVEALGGGISSTGLFSAGNTPGTFTNTVRATVGTIFGSATVVVEPGALASIEVTPSPDTLAIGATRQFIAVGRDALNNIVPITPVWSVEALGGGISSTGLFSAGNVLGTFTNTVRATVGTIFGSATVVVEPGPLAVIEVTPNPDTLNVQTTGQFVAVGRDANNNIVPVTPIWSVANGGGTIDLNGLFTAGNTTGEFLNTVRATDGLIFGEATVVVDLAPPFQPLGQAEPVGILAATAVTCISSGFIDADIVISPGNTLTGFPPCTFSGVLDLATANGIQAQLDLTTAYNTLAGLPCAPANAIVADLGGTTLAPGVYCTASGIGVTGDLTLDGNGDPNAVFVFQAGSTLITAGNVILINGATARNVYWQVGTSATLGTASQWQGNILSNVSITLVDGATLIGRALARTGAVTLGTTNTITLP
jgi:hypothetical protein